MGKADKKRAQQTLTNQGTTAQNYLGGVQNQIGGLNNNLMSAYWGNPVAPTYGAVPRGGFTPYSPYTGGRTAPGGNIGGGSTSDVQARLMPLLQSMGGASSANLERAMPQIQQMFPGARFDRSSGPKDEIVIPGVGIIDLISNAEGSGPKNWTFNVGSGGGGGLGGGGILGQQLGEYSGLMKQWQNWANTGGLSDKDKANIRARAISPIRSVYARGQQELARNRALQGGYSPGFGTLLGRFNREQGQQTSDATTNAEAAIAEMVQRGKLSGMGGMSSLYGATPGLSSMIGNQMMGAQNNLLQGSNLQNDIARMMISGQIGQGQMAGFPWAKTFGTIGAIAGAIPTGGMSLAALPGIMNSGSPQYQGFMGGGYV